MLRSGAIHDRNQVRKWRIERSLSLLIERQLKKMYAQTSSPRQASVDQSELYVSDCDAASRVATTSILSTAPSQRVEAMLNTTVCQVGQWWAQWQPGARHVPMYLLW